MFKRQQLEMKMYTMVGFDSKHNKLRDILEDTENEIPTFKWPTGRPDVNELIYYRFVDLSGNGRIYNRDETLFADVP